jgi:tRNA G10  N-methylase Trm11
MNAQYVIHLGKNNDLSLLELEAVLGQKPTLVGGVALTEKIPGPAKEVMDQLGGAIKISKVVWDGPGQADVIAQELIKQKPEGKLSFGLNNFPANGDKLKELLKKVKKALKAEGRNPRFINKQGNLTSAMIVKGGLMKNETDFNLIHVGEGTMISRTVAVQDFEGYSQRDYEKPARLAKAGMLPPKLAQTMVNLTQLVTGPTDFKDKTLYDPFCGSGTVLGEGLIKSMNVVGSDLSEEAVEAAKTNSEWIKRKYNSNNDVKIFLQDAAKLNKNVVHQSPDMVVTETYLGPPRRELLSADRIEIIYDEVMPLYLNFLEAIHPLLKPNTPLVIAFPVYHTPNGPMRLPNLIDQITPIGYKLHHRLTYRRNDQVVGRDLLILERT